MAGWNPRPTVKQQQKCFRDFLSNILIDREKRGKRKGRNVGKYWIEKKEVSIAQKNKTKLFLFLVRSNAD